MNRNNIEIIPVPDRHAPCDHGDTILTVRVGALRWAPHTCLGPDDTFDQVDGYLTDDRSWDDTARKAIRSLDVWAVDAAGTADLRADEPDAPVLAAKAWAAGRVHVLECGFALGVPGDVLDANLLAEALARYNP